MCAGGGTRRVLPAPLLARVPLGARVGGCSADEETRSLRSLASAGTHRAVANSQPAAMSGAPARRRPATWPGLRPRPRPARDRPQAGGQRGRRACRAWGRARIWRVVTVRLRMLARGRWHHSGAQAPRSPPSELARCGRPPLHSLGPGRGICACIRLTRSEVSRAVSAALARHRKPPPAALRKNNTHTHTRARARSHRPRSNTFTLGETPD